MNRHSLLFIVTIFLLVACGGGGTTTLMPEIEIPPVMPEVSQNQFQKWLSLR